MVFGRIAAAVVAAVLMSAGSAADESDKGESVSVQAASEDVVVAADGSYTDTTHTEIRAINEAGAMQASHISILYDSEMQQVEILEAHTLKPDGTKIPVDLGSIYEQLPPNNMLAVTSFRVKLLLFPQFSAGDTAVYTLRFRNPKAMFAGQFQYGKYFPRAMAFKDTKVTITAPKSLALRTETHDVPFTKDTQGDTIVYRWQKSSQAAKDVKTALISPLDHEPRFFVSSFKDYGELGRAYAAQSEPKMVVTAKVKALADEITTGTTSRLDQARLIYEWVAKHVRYVAIELGRGSLIPHDADAVIAKGYGDCKDHDVVLQALLKAKGIAAESILINSSNSYTLSEAPSFAQLDHVITYLPEFDTYLDSSTQVAPFGVLPAEEYGKPAVRASATAAARITLPVLAPGQADVATVTTAKLDDKGAISGTTKITAKGPHAINLRFIALGVQTIGGEKIAQGVLAEDGLTDGTGSIALGSPTDLTPEYSVTATFSAKGLSDWLDHGSERSMPKGLRLGHTIGDGMMGPLFPNDDADNDVTACASDHESEDISIALPAGTKPVDLPNDLKVETANLSFSAHWSFKDGTLALHREFLSKMTQPLCSGALRKDVAAALKRIADGYDAPFRLARSIETYTSKLNGNSKDVDALIQRGNAHNDNHEYDLALADFNEALKIDPKNTWALRSRASNYVSMKRDDLALEDYNRALELAPDYQGVWYDRGLIWAKQNNWGKAIDDFTTALKLDPKDAASLSARGRAYLMTDKCDLAVPDFDAALALKPDDGWVHFNRGFCRERQGHRDLALEDYSRSIALGGAVADAYGNRGSIYMSKGKNELAVADFDKALSMDPDNERIISQRASALMGLKQYARAVQDLSVIAAKHPDSVWAFEMRAFAYTQLKEYKKALADCNKIIALEPDNAGHYFTRATVETAMGDKAGTNRDVAKAIKLDPSLNK